MFEPNSQSISRPPSGAELMWDQVFRGLARAVAWLTIVVVLYLLFQIARAAQPAVQKYGFSFLTSKQWDSGKEQFGIAPQIWGTIYSSVLGVGIGAIFGLAVAIFLTEDFLPPRTATWCKNVVELLGA